MNGGVPQNATLIANPSGMTTKKRKKLFIEYWFKSSGNISYLCQQIGVDRKTFYRWMENDHAFKEAVLAEDEAFVDMAETQQHNLVAAGDPQSVRFTLRTKGKNRGYVERLEQDVRGQMQMTGDMKITIVHTREDDSEFLKEFEDEINREALTE